MYLPNIRIEIFIVKKTQGLTRGGQEVYPSPHPEFNRVKTFLYHLVYVSNAYIPNLRSLAPPFHLEKFVVGGDGGWWWVVVGGV